MAEPFPSVVNVATVGIGSDHADFAVDLEHGKFDPLEGFAFVLPKGGQEFGVGHSFTAQILVVDLTVANENGRRPVDHPAKFFTAQTDAGEEQTDADKGNGGYDSPAQARIGSGHRVLNGVGNQQKND